MLYYTHTYNTYGNDEEGGESILSLIHGIQSLLNEV